MAHDLRNPLNAIKLVLDRIQTTMPRENPAQKSLHAAQRAVLRMDHLIRDLVDATRIDQGRLMIDRKPERLDAILHEAADLYSAQAQENGPFLTVAPSAAGDAIVFCERDRIMQVLGNLIGNAMKFTPPAGRITLRATKTDDGAIRFEVEDTGPGIKPEHLPHIFERYWKTEPRGTGLGLFIAKNIVEAHGAALRVVSQPGQGALFWFDVPLPAAAAMPAWREPKRAPDPRPGVQHP